MINVKDVRINILMSRYCLFQNRNEFYFIFFYWLQESKNIGILIQRVSEPYECF